MEDASPSTVVREERERLVIGGCLLDENGHRLERPDKPIKLEPKTTQLLAYLARHANEPVSREKLLREVWPGVIVTDEALTNAVNKIRKAFGDDRKNPRVIETIPKMGYRLIAPVQISAEIPKSDIGHTEEPLETGMSPADGPGTRVSGGSQLSVLGKRPVLITGAILILGLASGLGLYLFFTYPPDPQMQSAPDSPVASTRPSIAVLPFSNLSNDPEQEYFVDGITEDLITDLSKVSGLFVVARTTAFVYKNASPTPQEVAEQLGVRYVLNGSLRKAGDRLRITAQLIDSETGRNIWADRYDRRLTEVFTVQDEVTKKIVQALAVKLTTAEKEKLGQSGTNNILAYDAFLRGRQYSNQRTEDAHELARAAYRQAIELDPSYARAYGALAVELTRGYQNDWTALSMDEVRTRALELAKRAVELDSTSPQAYWALSYVYLYLSQYDEATAAVQRSIALAPNYADGYGLLAFINNFRGKAEDAVTYIKKAMALNPYYTFDYPWNLGRAYYTLGRYAEAVEALQEAIERNENAVHPRLYLAASYVRLGRLDDAEWEIEQIEVLNPGTTITRIATTFPIENEDDRSSLFEDLRKAGLPE